MLYNRTLIYCTCLFQVYAMDVLVSTGEGVGREQDTRVTIYKKTEETYQLKLKASRMFYSEVSHKHGLMPFNLRTFEDEKKAKMAVVECVNHRLIEPFQVRLLICIYLVYYLAFSLYNKILIFIIFLYRCCMRNQTSTWHNSNLRYSWCLTDLIKLQEFLLTSIYISLIVSWMILN